jgi:hypothetical protein
MTLSQEINNQGVLGVLIDRLRPEAVWKRCDDYTALVATWEDQVQLIPTEQELTDEYALYQAELAAQVAVEQVKAGAKSQAQNVSNWASWDEAAALAWFDANVNTAADALPVLRAMVRMLIALRNEAYPDLQD